MSTRFMYDFKAYTGISGLGFTPIHLAASKGHLKALQHLVQFFDNPTLPSLYDSLTPIHLASINGFPEVVEFMLSICDGKWNPHVPDKLGVTPIHYAITYKHPDVLR